MAVLGPRAAVTLPAAAALALLLSFFLLKRRRSRANSECRSLSDTTACLLGSSDHLQQQQPTSVAADDDTVLAVVVVSESHDMRLRDGGNMGDVKLKGSRCSSATTTKSSGGAPKAPCPNSNARPSVCSPPSPQQRAARQRQQQDSADMLITAATSAVTTTAVREKSSPPCAVLTVEIPEQSAASGDRRPVLAAASSDDVSPAPGVGADTVCGASPSGSVDSLLGQSSSPPSSTVSPARRESGSESASPSLAQDVATLSLAEQQSTAATPAKQPEAAAEEPVASSAASTTTPSLEVAQPPTSTELQNDECASEDRSQAQALSFSDAHSEGSSDSGKGGSDIHGGSEAAGGAGNLSPEEELPRTYEFELPRELCGRFIGQGGRNVTAIKSRSNTRIYVHQHPFTSKLKICSIEGTPEEIRTALELIRKKFPSHAFPNLTLAQVNAEPLHYPGTITLPETLQLRLPDGVTCDVVLTSLVTAGHFFLQQPTHPTYPSLARLDQFMLACYDQGLDTPPLPHPVEAGIICAAQVCGGWFRALVVAPSDENEDCDIKFLDYGGYMTLSTSLLRQIRSDFMMLPFQASECYLANVQPAEDDSVWSAEACGTFEDLAQGQILQALIVGYADNGIPLVHLYRVQGVSSVFINRELVNRGVARWLEHPL